MPPPSDALAAALGEIVGAEHVLTDRDVTASYTTDWTGRFRGDAVARRAARRHRTGRGRRRPVRRRRSGGSAARRQHRTGRWRGPAASCDGRAVDAPARPRGAGRRRCDAGEPRRRRHARRLASPCPGGGARRAGRLRQPRLGDGRRRRRDQRRRVAGRAVRHDAVPGRRRHRGARRRVRGRLAVRLAEGDRRPPLAIAAVRERGDLGRPHRRAPAPGAVVPLHGDGAARDVRAGRGRGRPGSSSRRCPPPRRGRADPAGGDGTGGRASPRPHRRSEPAMAPSART